MAPNKKFDTSLIPEFPDLSFEVSLWEAGVKFVAGVDEAGRGALAGPVFAGVIVLPADPGVAQVLYGVRDSKQMTASEREYWAVRLRTVGSAWAVGFATHQEIDEIGIVPATRCAISRAIERLVVCPQHLLIDYLDIPGIAIPQTCLVKGDRRALSIAAASVLAKTARDEQMRLLDPRYPEYGFARHKGYGTRAHRDALQALGPSPIHRKSFHLKSV
jgi:ribonuclease HII